jgi:WD40 repeat protein
MGRRSFAVGILALTVVTAAGQPPKQPAFPPINPGQARLDQTVNGLDGPGFAVAVNEEAGTLAAACESGTIQYWNKDVSMGVRTGGHTPHVLAGHQGPVTALAWRGPVLASAGADGKINLWDLAEARPAHTLTAGAAVRALALSPDGKQLASAGDDPAVQLWDVATAKPATKLAGHADWVLCLAFSSDGKLLASAGYEGIVKLWDTASGKKLLDLPAKAAPQPNVPPPSTNVVQAVAFSPDSKFLAAGGSDAQVHLFSLPDGKLVRSLAGHTSSVTALQFHPSGTVLVSASKDRTLKLWNPANGQLLKSLEGHTAWVQGVTFLAQGTRLASVSADQTMRLWDLSEPKK